MDGWMDGRSMDGSIDRFWTRRGSRRSDEATKMATATMTREDHAKEKSPYYAHRIDLFDKYYARELERIEGAKAAGEGIKVTLPDGAVKEGTKYATTPYDVAVGIHKKL